jgi:aspartyl-tRNA(Asn)/glutamyl-tRNA(Gln) amidotransferase subunit A
MLARADAVDAVLGTYLARFDEQALASAARADRELAEGVDRGPLHGIPIGIKDILAVAEGPTTANSLVLDRAWGAGRDGPTVARLKVGGAVITGKLSTMEFAIGLADPSKPFPIPTNPWNVEHWPGGSSSGTGSGVSAGLFYAGIGTDTGGSIRIPAAFCGTSGLMPTFGRVPKSGCAPLGYSLDHVGPLARSARDCAAFLGVVAGYHPSDESCVDRPVDDYLRALSGDLSGVRIGVVRALVDPPGADPALRACFQSAIGVLESLGAHVIDVELPLYDEVTMAMMVTMASEALAYHRTDMQHRWDDYFVGTRTTIALGALMSATDFVQAQRVRRVALRQLADLYSQVDIVVSPTAAIGAPTREDLDPKRSMDLLHLINTGYWDATGNPVLVVPMGFTGAGLPLSLQMSARPFEEALLCRAGDAYQSATDWHLRVPPLMDQTPALA